MRIYIKNYNLNKLYSKLKKLEEYLKDIHIFREIYSEEGIYQIDSNHIYKLFINDKPIKQYDEYCNDLTLILDLSCIQKIKENQIPVDGIETCVKNMYYSLQTNSKIKLVIQFDNSSISSNENIINSYFEINDTEKEEIDLDNYFIKNELNVFLSLLN